jgi:hypothetical protein
MLFGILSRCDSMTEIYEGMRALGRKLNHLGLTNAPAKSTTCDGLRNRDSRFFEDLYFSLVKNYQSFLSDSRTFGLTFKEVLLDNNEKTEYFIHWELLYNVNGECYNGFVHQFYSKSIKPIKNVYRRLLCGTIWPS